MHHCFIRHTIFILIDYTIVNKTSFDRKREESTLLNGAYLMSS